MEGVGGEDGGEEGAEEWAGVVCGVQEGGKDGHCFFCGGEGGGIGGERVNNKKKRGLEGEQIGGAFEGRRTGTSSWYMNEIVFFSCLYVGKYKVVMPVPSHVY